MTNSRKLPEILEILSERRSGPYVVRAEIVSYSGSRPVLSINRYRAKVADFDSEELDLEYAGRAGFDEASIQWLEEEDVFSRAERALSMHNASR